MVSENLNEKEEVRPITFNPLTLVNILMISSELPEIVGMSDRIIVMWDGTIVGELPANSNEAEIMLMATGHGNGDEDNGNGDQDNDNNGKAVAAQE